MTGRAAFLDRSIGETRAVVTLNDEPERLIIRRQGEPESQRLGARSIARAARRDAGLAMLFVSMPDGGEAVTPLPAARALPEGAAVEVEVTAEARRGKGAVVRVLGPATGAPELLSAAPALETLLGAWAPGGIKEGPEARERADEAQEAALQTVHPLSGGGSLAIETTRALTAIDVDVGGRGGSDAARSTRAANLAAIQTAARLLRLKGLGGLVVFDLAGKGHDGAALAAAARTAFAPDEPGVAIGPISRFGLFELALPWRTRPVAEVLTSADSQALALIRALEREGRAHPGSRLIAACSPDLARAAEPWLDDLADRLGRRFAFEARAGERWEVRTA